MKKILNVVLLSILFFCIIHIIVILMFSLVLYDYTFVLQYKDNIDKSIIIISLAGSTALAMIITIIDIIVRDRYRK